MHSISSRINPKTAKLLATTVDGWWGTGMRVLFFGYNLNLLAKCV